MYVKLFSMLTFAMLNEKSTGTKATLPMLKWETRLRPSSTGYWQVSPYALPAQAIGRFTTLALPRQRSFPVH